MPGMGAGPVDAAAAYLSRGYIPVPIPLRQKGPDRRGWQHARPLADDLPRMFGAPCNIGLLLGSASHHLTDVDLDCTEAVALADRFLPPTNSVFGRASKRRAHFLYICPGAVKENYSDPIEHDRKKKTLVELRTEGRDGGGHQTLAPPSIHPEGENVEWDVDSDPAKIEPGVLALAVARLAVGCLLARYVPNASPDASQAVAISLLDGVDGKLGDAARIWLGLSQHQDDNAPQRSHTGEIGGGSVDELAEALDSIPNNDLHYDDWIRIGLAIKATAGESGRALWERWSDKAPKNQPGITARKWATFKPTGIQGATIFYLARQHGWRPQRERVRQHQGAASNGPESRLGEDISGDQATSAPEPEARVQPPGTDLPLQWYDDIEESLDTADFVEGVLMDGSAAVLYGESNSGKTFLACDLALHVAAGLPWMGRDVEIGSVIYCALEGSRGLSNRVAAWRREHDIHGLPFAVIHSAINLLDPMADTPRLISTALAVKAKIPSYPLRLIIIDTLARSMVGGSENEAEDMGSLISNMDAIRRNTGACVLFVHHTGKDPSRGSRGHSSLRAAVDTEIEVQYETEDPIRRAKVVKQRELGTNAEIAFSLQVVALGINNRGRDVTTCIVVPEKAEEKVRTRHLSNRQKIALDILNDLVARAGETIGGDVPANIPSVPEDWWRNRFYERAMPGADTNTKKQAFRRTADSLMAEGMVGLSKGRVWPVPRRASGNSRTDGVHGDD